MERHSSVFFIATFILGLAGLAAGFALGYGRSAAAGSTSLLIQYGITSFGMRESNPGWTSNSFGCGGGGLAQFHYEAASSNNSIWYECQ